MAQNLTQRPVASTYGIEDLVPLALRGGIRIPAFQRMFKWRSADVRDLFDSIFRGFPIGTLLFWKRKGEAGTVKFGPIEVSAGDRDDALWIVDGQQRITSLVAALAPDEGERGVFDVYFDLGWDGSGDAAAGPFHSGDQRRTPERTWLPLREALDSERLDAWLDASDLRAANAEYARRARRLNKLIREYRIPAYTVETDEPETLGLIFDRVNTSGRRLERSEVFNALLRSNRDGASLADVGREAARLGFLLDDDLLLKVVLVTNGHDVLASNAKSLHGVDKSPEALGAAETALVRSVEFLKRDADIPHATLLPYTFPVLVLSLFHRTFPNPSPRSRALLARWVWRGAVTGDHRAESIPAVRATLKVVGDQAAGEDAVVQRLLADVPTTPRDMSLATFRFGTAQAKIALGAMASLGPRHLTDGTALEVGTLLAKHGGHAVLTLGPRGAAGPSKELGNLLIHPPLARGLLEAAIANAPPDILASHGIDLAGAEALAQCEYAVAIAARTLALKAVVDGYLVRHARWDETDRPPIHGLLGALPQDDPPSDALD